jgi:DNA repair exonuclease SbcCD ATPase subunit
MSRRNRTPNKVTYNLDDEVNIREYPFHRYIPIDSISEKQKRLFDRQQVVQNITRYEEEKVILPMRPVTPIPVQVYNGPSIGSVPVLQLVPTGGENCYRVDMTPVEDLKNLEARHQDLQVQIDRNIEVIQGQLNAITTNEQSLAEQASTINANNQAIHNNNTYINQQLGAFNHNSNILQQQAYYINSYNAEIARQQQMIEDLKQQVSDTQAQLDDVQLQLEGSNNQLVYHGTMLNAFNTLIQNPEYFQQLMTMASGFNPEQVYDVTNTT